MAYCMAGTPRLQDHGMDGAARRSVTAMSREPPWFRHGAEKNVRRLLEMPMAAADLTAATPHASAIALRFARRELRAGARGFAVFLACLALGVMAIAGI